MCHKKMAIFTTVALMASNLLFSGENIEDFSKKMKFEGKVVPIVTMDIRLGYDAFANKYRGFIDYVMPAGTFFSGPVFDADGKLVKNGDILVQIESAIVKNQYECDLAMLSSAKASLDDKENIFNTNKKLITNKSISQKAFISSEAEYLQALANYKKAKIVVEMTKKVLDNVCTLRARFDGIVNKVLFSGGWAEGFPAVINISQLDPISISIPLDRNKAIDFNYNTPITIYPNQKRGAPVGYLQGRSSFRDGQLTILVNNYKLPPPVNLNPDNSKSIPVVQTWCNVKKQTGLTNHRYTQTSLIVSKDALIPEDGNVFVWLVEDSNTGIAGEGMKYLHKVKKIEVKTDSKTNSIPENVNMISFTPKQNTNVSEGTVFLSSRDLPSDLEDGDTVCLYAGMYTFMPGETVVVEIGPNPETIE